MKNTGKCPKCTSEEVLLIPNNKNFYGGAISRGLIANTAIHRYVCFSCGFTEEWINTAEDLKKLKKYADENDWDKEDKE